MITRDEIEIVLTRLEQMLKDLRERVDEIDERTKQFKPWTQTQHPDA